MAERLPVLPALDKGSIVTVGTFDGVHRGHQDVLARLVARAEARSLPSVVVTFDPHPLEVVNPHPRCSPSAMKSSRSSPRAVSTM
jgi:cytidyltransferase-like protein